jgi:hypothetical protein
MFVLGGITPLFADVSDPKLPKVLCRDIGPAGVTWSYKGDWWEFQANMAMGHLLMPTPLVRKAALPYLSSAGGLGATVLFEENLDVAARGLSDMFDVNPVMARIRIEKLYKIERSGQLML